MGLPFGIFRTFPYTPQKDATYSNMFQCALKAKRVNGLLKLRLGFFHDVLLCFGNVQALNGKNQPKPSTL